MSWFKTLAATAKETARDLKSAARDAARDLGINAKTTQGSDPLNEVTKIRTTKSFSNAIDSVDRLIDFGPLPDTVLAEVIIATAQNPMLRQSCKDFPPLTSSDSASQFSLHLHSLVTRNTSIAPFVWSQLIESFFRSLISPQLENQVTAWLVKLVNLLATPAEDAIAHTESLNLLRKLRTQKETFERAPNAQLGLDIAKTARAIHQNVAKAENRKKIRSESLHLEISQILSETQIYLDALDTKGREANATVASTEEEIQSIQQKLDLPENLEISQTETTIKSLLSEAAVLQSRLNEITAELSKASAERSQIDSALIQVNSALHAALDETQGLIEEQEREIASLEVDARSCSSLKEAVSSYLANLGNQTSSPTTQRWTPKAAQACADYVLFRESEIKEALEALRTIEKNHPGLAEDHNLSDVSEAEAAEAVGLLVVAEERLADAAGFCEKFRVQGIGRLQEALEDCKRIAAPFKIRLAEISLMRAIAQEPASPTGDKTFLIESPTSGPSFAPPSLAKALTASAPAQEVVSSPATSPEPKIKRRDSFEDLLGI